MLGLTLHFNFILALLISLCITIVILSIKESAQISCHSEERESSVKASKEYVTVLPCSALCFGFFSSVSFCVSLSAVYGGHLKESRL